MVHLTEVLLAVHWLKNSTLSGVQLIQLAEVLLAEVHRQKSTWLKSYWLKPNYWIPIRWSPAEWITLSEVQLAEVQMTGVLLAEVQLSEEFCMKSDWEKFNFMTWLLAEVKVDDSGLKLFNLDKLKFFCDKLKLSNI